KRPQRAKSIRQIAEPLAKIKRRRQGRVGRSPNALAARSADLRLQSRSDDCLVRRAVPDFVLCCQCEVVPPLHRIAVIRLLNDVSIRNSQRKMWKDLLVKLNSGDEFMVPRAIFGATILRIKKRRQRQLIHGKRIVRRDGGGEETFADITMRFNKSTGKYDTD